MNMNKLAKQITLIEGGKKNLDIAQVKEVLKIICRLMRHDPELLISMWRAGKGKKK